jgi:methylthioribose-1-phosphate isomerase
MKPPLLMNINSSVFLKDDVLVMIDRRCLPHKKVEVIAADYEEAARAIEDMVVQGAGDIAITAGYGLYLAAVEAERNSELGPEAARSFILAARERLINTRPTGRYLPALLAGMIKKVEWEQAGRSSQLLLAVNAGIDKQQRRSESTGKWASQLLEDGDGILTHCFPGAALLYMLCQAKEQGKNVNVICSETRPYLQGARLTAWSVAELEIPVTLITDNMAAYCMSQGMITKVFAAADRIAMDGTVANKIGTFPLALAADYHKLPFYILGYGGPDRSCREGKDIMIEQRDPAEVLSCNGIKISSDKVKGFYPAFDLTPAHLIKAIITDRGMIPSSQVEQYWSL